MQPSITLNPPLGQINTHGAPFTDFAFSADGTFVLPWDAVAVQVWAIGGGGGGGMGGYAILYTSNGLHYSGLGGSGAGSGYMATSGKLLYPTPGGLITFQIGLGGLAGIASPYRIAAPGGATTVSGLITLTANGGGAGQNGFGTSENNSYGADGVNQPGRSGGSGAAGGGASGGQEITSAGVQNRGTGGNGQGTTGSAGAVTTGGNGGAYLSPNGSAGNESAVSTQPLSVFRPFGDASVTDIFFDARGGDGGRTGAYGGSGGFGARPPSGLTGTGYGRGGDGGNGGFWGPSGWTTQRTNGTDGVQGVVVIRVYWEN